MALGLSNRVPWSSSTISHPVWHLENLPYKSKGTQRNRVAVQHAWNFGQVRGQTVPCDASIQVEDVSELSAEDASWFRSIVGMCLYLSRDRPDIMFTAKEVASRMSRPTLAGLQHLKKLMGYLKATGELGVFLKCPQPSQGKWKVSLTKFWVLESYSDADWAPNKQHRRSISCGLHMLKGFYLFGSAKTQRVIALSSCESELYSIVSTMSDALCIKRCLELVLQVKMHQIRFTDSSSARQLCNRQGCGKTRHLSGKILWVQDIDMSRTQQTELAQVPDMFNLSDIGTMSLGRKRLMALMNEIGMIYVETGESVGQAEAEQAHASYTTSRNVSKLAKISFPLGQKLQQQQNMDNAMNQRSMRTTIHFRFGFSFCFWLWGGLFFAVTAWM